MLCAIVKKNLSDKILFKITFSFERFGQTDFSEIFTSGSLIVNRTNRELKIAVTALVSKMVSNL